MLDQLAAQPLHPRTAQLTEAGRHSHVDTPTHPNTAQAVKRLQSLADSWAPDFLCHRHALINSSFLVLLLSLPLAKTIKSADKATITSRKLWVSETPLHTPPWRGVKWWCKGVVCSCFSCFLLLLVLLLQATFDHIHSHWNCKAQLGTAEQQ